MVEEKEAQIPAKYNLDAKWDACLDLGMRRFVYSSVAGAFAGLLLFRSPATRWASVALGAGIGIGSAYSDCCHNFGDLDQNRLAGLLSLLFLWFRTETILLWALIHGKCHRVCV